MKDFVIAVIGIVIILYIFAMFFVPGKVPGSEIWKTGYVSDYHKDSNFNVNNFSIEQFRKDLNITQ